MSTFLRHIAHGNKGLAEDADGKTRAAVAQNEKGEVEEIDRAGIPDEFPLNTMTNMKMSDERPDTLTISLRSSTDTYRQMPW